MTSTASVRERVVAALGVGAVRVTNNFYWNKAASHRDLTKKSLYCCPLSKAKYKSIGYFPVYRASR